MSVRLCMLARDEADRMPSVAAACDGLYDDWIVLLDDRDAGETEAAAHAELAGPGAVERHTFEDFSQARNLLFEHARRGLGADDFLLLVDPDSPPTGVLPGLVHDWYECTWTNAATDWRLPILVRATLACHYEGRAHELLVVDAEASLGFAEELAVTVKTKPFSVERAEMYLDLLLPEAPRDPRAAFYLARTYRDLGRTGEAIEAYLRCAQMPQWDEQVYVALLDAGYLLAGLDVELGRVLLERAHALRPKRGDGLYALAWLANQMGDPQRASVACAEAIQLPPSTDRLFVNRWAEHEGILLELGVAINALRDRAGLASMEE